MAGTKEGAAKRLQTNAVKGARLPGGIPSGPEVPTTISGHTFYVVGKRALKHGDRTYRPGEAFPPAKDFPRLESWLRTGMLVQMS